MEGLMNFVGIPILSFIFLPFSPLSPILQSAEAMATVLESIDRRLLRLIPTGRLGLPHYSNLKVEVEFGSGSVFSLSVEFLRVHSPIVDAKLRSITSEKVISGRRLVGIMSAGPVRNFWHKTGIFIRSGEQQVEPLEKLY